MTLVSHQPEALTEGTSYLFFTNCVAVGGQVVVRDVHHIEWSNDALRQVAQLAKEQPLQKRVAAADLIVTGRVISCSPVETRPAAKSKHNRRNSDSFPDLGQSLRHKGKDA